VVPPPPFYDIHLHLHPFFHQRSFSELFLRLINPFDPVQVVFFLRRKDASLDDWAQFAPRWFQSYLPLFNYTFSVFFPPAFLLLIILVQLRLTRAFFPVQDSNRSSISNVNLFPPITNPFSPPLELFLKIFTSSSAG